MRKKRTALAAAIRRNRLRIDISQPELGGLVGVSGSAISKYERSQKHDPAIAATIIAALERVFGLTQGELVAMVKTKPARARL